MFYKASCHIFGTTITPLSILHEGFDSFCSWINYDIHQQCLRNCVITKDSLGRFPIHWAVEIVIFWDCRLERIVVAIMASKENRPSLYVALQYGVSWTKLAEVGIFEYGHDPITGLPSLYASCTGGRDHSSRYGMDNIYELIRIDVTNICEQTQRR